MDLLTGTIGLAIANSLILGFIAYTLGRRLDALDYVGFCGFGLSQLSSR